MPGFDALTLGRAQLWSLGSAKTFGPNTVNDFHASLTHNANNVGVPNGGTGVTARVAGVRHRPRHARHRRPRAAVRRRREPGVQHVHDGRDDHRRQSDRRHAASLATASRRCAASHTLKFGGQYQFQQVRLEPNATFNGTFTFAGTETGSDFADFLLGVPSNYIQSSGGDLLSAESVRRRVRAGQLARALEPDDQLRRAVGHHGAVVREGQPDPDDRARPAVGGLSRTRRCGLVFPGDTGISRGLSPTRFGNLSPRLGIAYSPNEKTSLRASYGLFYTAFQGLSAGIMYGVPPYGYNYLSPAPPLFETPFITAADGTNNGQRFPQQFPPLGRVAEQPDHQHRLVAVSARQRRSVLRRTTTRRRTRRTSCSRCSASWRRTWSRRSATSARAATTCWCSSRPIPAIPRSVSA